MKYFKFILSLLLTVAVFYGLNTKFGNIPPIGKFLAPSQGIWQNEINEFDDIETLTIIGLSAPVTVHYDEYLIPHIFAQNDSDLYKAQGYITAKHRLWQMDFQIRAAGGILSEVIGEAAINYDRRQRRKGMVFGAENNLKVMENDPETKAQLEAYRDGVNAYISTLNSNNYPVEYKLLDYKPEFWTLKKTALLLMFMTDMLAGGDSDLEYTNLLTKFGKERFDLLFPDFYKEADPVIPTDSSWASWNVKIPEAPELALIDSTHITKVLPKPNPDNGSNNWAVGSKKSYSGNPILANDPHLGLNLPSIWFALQLATPEKNTFGVSLPGAAGIIVGFNNNISWGVTNATRDVKDWYKITFKDSNRNEYFYNNQWRTTSKKVEKIKVRHNTTVIDTVIYTHHGPVTYDKNFNSNKELIGYAMKWVGHIGGNNQKALLALNKAKNYNDYEKAIVDFSSPAQNIIFSSQEGDIALWVQGKFPNKWKGQGKFLMDGSKPTHDWQGFIPQEHNAHTKNPERGFVSSANQSPTDESYPYYYFNDGYDTSRSRVINNFFRSKETFNIQDFKDLHNNNFNLKAAELLPYMISTMDVSSLTEEEELLLSEVQQWDFYNEINKLAPTIWEVWWNRLFILLWDEMRDQDTELDYPFSYRTIELLKNDPDNEFMDIVETSKKETARDLFLISFKDAAKRLNTWKSKNDDYNWGAYKATYIGHLLQGLPAFSRFNLPIGGNSGIVNATSKNHGPSWRMIVEMSSPPKALGIYPGGQSGNPGSKYYDNFIDTWAAGEYININFLQSVDQIEGIRFTQTLTPKQ